MEESNKSTMYIGPSIPKFNLSRNQVFTGELPNTAKALIEEHALASVLFIKPNELANSLVTLKTKGSLLDIQYNELIKKFLSN